MRNRTKLGAVTGLLGGLAFLAPAANAQLLGVNAEPPTIEYNGTGTVEYTVNDDPGTPLVDEARLLRITADPLKFRDALNVEYDIAVPKDVEINIRVLSNDGSNIGGVAGDDLIITGQIDINGDGDFTDPEDFSGVLLTGEVTKFGFQDFSGALDFFDFCFRPTGGALIDAGLFVGRDIGVNQRLEFSGFDGDFDSNFSARAKGTAGSTAAKGTGDGLIGNFVWNDVDRDGIQDPNELGISGVTVILRDDQNQIVSVAVTNFQGLYEFPDVAQGTYTVSIDPTTLPEGAFATDSDIGGDDTVDSDGSGVTVVVPDDTTVDLTIDFGYIVPGSASLGDFVWLDSNLDGIQDAGEPGITNVTVRLFDAGFNLIATTQTDANGNYEFLGLIPGTYTVFLDSGTLPPGYVATTANAGGDTALDSSNSPVTVTLGEDEFNRTIDFGFISPGTGRIGDFIWQDTNNNGIQDPGEPGIQGVVVELINDSGRVIATAVTDGNGNYQFSGLPAGDYVVRIDPGQPTLAGLMPSPADQGGDDAADSDGTFIPVTLPNDSTVNLTLDSGFVPAGQARLGDFVFIDTDRDGIQDFDEPGIPNVTVELRDPADNSLIAMTTTDGNGAYLFTGLNAGDYRVVVVNPPAGFTPTDPNVGLDDTIDSDGPLDGSGVLVNLPTQTSEDLTIDFGYQPPAMGRIGNFIWHDQDNDGIQDAGEPGLEGIRVILRDDQGTVVGDMLTLTDGLYLFEGLTAGTYTVDIDESTLPTGFTITTTDAGNDDTIDSDGPQDGSSVTVVLATDDSEDLTIDFGYNSPAEGRIGDFVWNDTNRDGIQDPGEEGIEGVRVELRDPIDMSLIAVTFTEFDGSYLFTGLLAGDYKVQVIPPADATASPVDQGNDDTLDSDPNGVIVTLPGNQDEDITIDFGFYFEELGRIGDFVWFDANENGVQDAGETGISGVTVNLFDGNGTLLETQVTDGAGMYLFDMLAAGDYRVDVEEASLPAGFVITTTDTGGNDEIDNDGPQDGSFVAVTLPLNNSEDLTIDFGYIRPANGAIGDRIWDDLNGDGVQDAGEPGLEGVTVTLIDKDTGNVLDTQVTDANGNYLFNDLPAGNYTIQISNLPAGYGQTGDPDGTNDNMTMLTLGVDETNLDQDFGYNRPQGRLGDFVWLDLDADGIQDAGENGIANVTVNLLQGGTIIATQVTDANGAYLFTGLRGGDYQVDVVEASLPAGVAETTQDAGNNDAVDSDVNANGDPVNVTLVGDNDEDLTIDFGYVGTGSIGDFIWQDNDGDGQQDVGEPGIAGVTVKLIDANGNTIATTVTDANGGYLFDNLPAGDYSVMIDPATVPAGLEQTFDLDGVLDGMTTITLGAGEDRDDVDFGYRPNGALGDFVWIDTNGNGQQDAGEPGIAGVTVNLIDANGNIIAIDTTDANGLYRFDGLNAGTYQVDVVEETLPAGVIATRLDVGDDATDSDAPANGAPVTVGLGTSEVNLTIDFGYVQPASLGNYVFVDTNANGLQDDGQTGVPGVIVELLNNNGDVIATTSTDANGFYLFDGLLPGVYRVRFIEPVGFDFTTANVGADDAIDSDADVTSGLTNLVVLQSGDINLTVDAGLVEEVVGQCPKSIDFELDGAGSPLAAGTIIDNEYTQLGVTISSANPANPVMIFDTANPTGGDTDLRTPGTGSGNTTVLGNVLILSEDGDSNDPDDNAGGGTMIFEFAQAVEINALRLLDIEGAEAVRVRVYDENGRLLNTVMVNGNGDNSVQLVTVNTQSVSRMEVQFTGSGALAEIIYCDDPQPPVDCGACDGKVSELTLEYNGSTGGVITVRQRNDGQTIFSGQVNPGETFSFTGADGQGTMTSEINIYLDGVLIQRIHTSCSQPIGIGLVFGDFTVVDGESRNGGPFCPADMGNCMEAIGVDVGQTGGNNSSSYDAAAGKWTINSDGWNWGTEDGLHFVHKMVDGDTQIVARLTSLTNSAQWNRAGVMIRDSLDANAKNVALNWFKDYQAVDMSKRFSTGGETSAFGWVEPVGLPVWMRLTRTGDVFRGEISNDGQNWQLIAEKTVPMSSPVKIGIWVAGHDWGNPATGMFDNVSVDGASLEDDCSDNPPPNFGSIGDRVWLDENANGLQEPSEPGIANVTVKLLNGNGQVIATDVTDANGNYLFENLAAGSYAVMIDGNTLPADLIQSFELDGDLNGMVAVNLVAGENPRNVDFGYFNPQGNCGDCAGGVTQITLKNIKSHALWIDIKQWDTAGNKVVTYSQQVQPGETFTLNGLLADGAFGDSFWVFVDGYLVADPITDCSENITLGKTYAGKLEVVGGASKDGGPFCELVTDKGEVGKVTVTQNDAYQWHTVVLQGTYTDPVVVMSSQTANSEHPINIRLRNITTTSFQFQVDEWNYQNGYHPAETYSYLVMERGTHTLANGAKVVAGSTDFAAGYNPNVWVNFGTTFNSTPVVVSQIANANSDDAGVTRQSGISTTGFRLYQQEEQAANQYRRAGRVDWIAIEKGVSTVSNMKFEASITGDNQNQYWRNTYFAQNYQWPIVLSAQQTRDGGDTASVRARWLMEGSVEFKIEEEQSYDEEVAHTSENIGFFVFDKPGVID